MRPPLITSVPIAPAPRPLSHEDGLLLLGSCFSSDVGSRLAHLGHPTLSNPLGTLYNPSSLRRCLEWFADGTLPTESELAYCSRRDVYFSFDAGTSHARETPDECVASLGRALTDGRESLLAARALFLTLGSAWAYDRNGRIVANCHRQPQGEFTRTLLSPQQVEAHVLGAVSAARSVNPHVHVVLTVSPVRHWREGAVESSRSKAHLISAAHAACAQLEHATYFPSYEILMDELRDYRWYSEDLLHPSNAAAEYGSHRPKAGCGASCARARAHPGPPASCSGTSPRGCSRATSSPTTTSCGSRWQSYARPPATGGVRNQYS